MSKKKKLFIVFFYLCLTKPAINMKKIVFLIGTVIVLAGCNQKSNWNIESPDGNIRAELFLSDTGTLSYTVYLDVAGKNITAIEPSVLGLERKDADFSSGLNFISASEVRTVSESYKMAAGKKLDISYTVNETEYLFENAEGKQIVLQFRIFNDGVAYRYQFPDRQNGSFAVLKELSEFNIPDEGSCWSQPYDAVSKWTPAYETYYVRSMPIGTPAPANKNGWSFPVTFTTSGLWILITESNLDGTYPASHLQPDCINGSYRMRWPEAAECFGSYDNFGNIKLPWVSPWRVIIVGTSPAAIIESTIVTDLADPSKIDDISWIKPGHAAWSWWSDSDSPQYVKRQNKFTDLAVEMGWEYNLIDANWDNMKDGDVTDAISYANKKGIGVLLWYNSGGKHNSVTEAPRNRMWDPEIRAKEFKKLADWGVKGVKVDFFQSDKQEIIQEYLGILKDAAENKIMANFHGCTLPRGWNRTWPNMVSMEAVPGGEVYKFGKDYPKTAPWHNTVLPFTRNAVGPMDYTPVMFTEHAMPHITTYAHELASCVVFESGIIHMADKVEAYLGLPVPVRNFLMQVPAAWEDVKFIDGYPGDFVILARKKGNKWYVAGLNGNDKPRTFTVTTDFLGKGKYILEQIMDGAGSNEFSYRQEVITGGTALEIPVLAFGGFVATLGAE